MVLRWLALLTVLALIGSTATFAIGHFRYGTDRARKTEFRLADAHAAAYAASAAEWRMIAHRRGDVKDAGAFARNVVAIRTALAQIAAADAKAVPRQERLSTLLQRYARAVRIELSALRNNDVPSAKTIDENESIRRSTR